MRNCKNKFLALVLITSAAFFSCKKEDPLEPLRKAGNDNPPVTNTITTNSVTKAGDWKVTSYVVGKTDNTEAFGIYTFTFAKDGSVLAATREKAVKGTWSAGKFNTFLIRFPADSQLTTLSNEWHVVNRTASDMVLEAMTVNGEVAQISFHKFDRQIEIGQLN